MKNKNSHSRTINDNLERMAKTLYDYWFVQFDFPDENGKPYKSSGGKMIWNEILRREIPEGWEVRKMIELISVKDGTHDSPKYVSQGYSLITSKNLNKKGINFSETNKISELDYHYINLRSKVENGDILFSMIGNIGTIYKVEEQSIDFAIKNIGLFKTSEKEYLKNYIFQYLHSYDMNRYIPNVVSGSIQKFIGLNSLRNIPTLYNISTIEDFDKKCSPTFTRISNNIKQNQQLGSLRDWLLPMLMNGQIKVE